MSVTKDTAFSKTVLEIRTLADSLCGLVGKAAKAGESLYETERAVLKGVLEIGRKAMDALLELQGNGDLGENIVTEQGDPLRRSQAPQGRPLRTIFGEHRFEQFTYSPGSKRAIELRPIDARLSLSPRVCSYLLEEFSQLFCVESAFGQSARNLAAVFDQQISVDTLETVSREMGVAAETYLDELPVPPATEEAELLVATMDGKGVPLIQPQPVKVKAFETRRLRPGNRRMATLAGVYSVDRHVRTPQQIVAALFRDELPDHAPSKRPVPQFKHLSVHFPEPYADGEDIVMSTGGIEGCCWLAHEIDERRQKDQPVLLLIDGDHRLWDTARDHLPADRVEILDIVHVSAYVWEASQWLCDGPAERETFTRLRLLRILEGGTTAVIRGLRHMASARHLRGEAGQRITTITKYFEAHAHRMQYQDYLKAGFPIATGVIEGACRHLVKDRMERSGMRWTQEGAKAMLNVRAVRESGLWDEFHATRRTLESKTQHPHRTLLNHYKPMNLAC